MSIPDGYLDPAEYEGSIRQFFDRYNAFNPTEEDLEEAYLCNGYFDSFKHAPEGRYVVAERMARQDRLAKHGFPQRDHLGRAIKIIKLTDKDLEWAYHYNQMWDAAKIQSVADPHGVATLLANEYVYYWERKHHALGSETEG